MTKAAESKSNIPEPRAGSGPEADTAPAADRPRRRRRWFRYTLPGAWTALVFACLSFTPSLLPRDGLIQGVVTGITAAIGYALGVAGAFAWREIRDRPPRVPSRTTWLVFAGVAVLLLVASFLAGLRWQGQLRDLMDVDAPPWWSHALLPVVAAVLFVILVAVGRLLRKVYQWLARLLSRVIGARAAHAVGFATVVIVALLVGNGIVVEGTLSLADTVLTAYDRSRMADIEQPTSNLRSGGPASNVQWDDMGQQGRRFVATGPTAQQISDFTGEPALDPIRVFVGASSADDPEVRAQLALQDLTEMGGFQREYLLVATTTGSGSLNASSVDSFEYMTGGNSAIVAVQYSHLPSWISYLVDQERAREAGRELFDFVYGAWSQLPFDQRPKLMVFGESLGSFGGESAFSGEFDLANRTSAALFVGPPNFNILFSEFVAGRDAGTPQVDPVYKNGRIVRFTNVPEEPVAPIGQPWQDGHRTLYVLHPSDPIVWWSPALLYDEPDWLDEAPGHDVLDEMQWVPLLTFWQVTADLPVALGVPPGHGHDYAGQHAFAWAEVLQLDNWTAEEVQKLSDITTAE
jgi:uncharacterized membrane protein